MACAGCHARSGLPDNRTRPLHHSLCALLRRPLPACSRRQLWGSISSALYDCAFSMQNACWCGRACVAFADYDDALHDVHSFLEFIEAKLASSQYLSAPMSRLIARTSIGSCSEWVRVMLSDTLLPRLSGRAHAPFGCNSDLRCAPVRSIRMPCRPFGRVL